MKAEAIVAEIGSTTTVVTAFSGLNGSSPRILGQAASPTTATEGDVTCGLAQALKELGLSREDLSQAAMMATSSAAGGLKMTVHGLVHDMTVRAAREAALGAGAIVRYVTAGDITPADGDAILAIRPSIILLAGGVDHGERATAVANARVLAGLGLTCPVVYAGNRAAAGEVRAVLARVGMEVRVVDNVYPRVDQLEVEPARRAIQAVFERHITEAPGMGRVREIVKGTILPTPGAVMRAAELLYRDTGSGLLVIDVGGATTDVHSVVEPSAEVAALLVNPEPLAKRTVEGDLGIVANAVHVAELLAAEDRTRLEERLRAPLESLLTEVAPFPTEPRQSAFALALAGQAARTALERHVGRYLHYYGPTGRLTVATGKDLGGVTLAIGTGGAFTRLEGGQEVLRKVLGRPTGLELWPREARAVIDRDYVMAAAGVLARSHPRAAIGLLLNSIGEG
ncbi:MAG: glutamate mutase L [bacterium]|nr:glutamate mutase L [bacterium]